MLALVQRKRQEYEQRQLDDGSGEDDEENDDEEEEDEAEADADEEAEVEQEKPTRAPVPSSRPAIPSRAPAPKPAAATSTTSSIPTKARPVGVPSPDVSDDEGNDANGGEAEAEASSDDLIEISDGEAESAVAKSPAKSSPVRTPMPASTTLRPQGNIFSKRHTSTWPAVRSLLQPSRALTPLGSRSWSETPDRCHGRHKRVSEQAPKVSNTSTRVFVWLCTTSTTGSIFICEEGRSNTSSSSTSSTTDAFQYTQYTTLGFTRRLLEGVDEERLADKVGACELAQLGEVLPQLWCVMRKRLEFLRNATNKSDWISAKWRRHNASRVQVQSHVPTRSRTLNGGG